MDEENKQEQQNKTEQGEARQHVHVFGAEVDSAAGGDKDGDWTKRKAETKEEWRKHREQRRAEWRAERREWRHEHHHESGLFWGLILLLVGVLALMDTMGYVSPIFWHAIVPFWPLLLILWGASIILGRHWFARFILFIFALIFLVIVILYGLVRAGSPLVSSISPNVVRAVQTAQPQQY